MTDLDLSWLSGRALRAARVLSGLTAGEAAKAAGIGEATLKRAEAAMGQPRLTRANAATIIEAYRTIGIHIDGIPGTNRLIIRVES